MASPVIPSTSDVSGSGALLELKGQRRWQLCETNHEASIGANPGDVLVHPAVDLQAGSEHHHCCVAGLASQLQEEQRVLGWVVGCYGRSKVLQWQFLGVVHAVSSWTY